MATSAFDTIMRVFEERFVPLPLEEREEIANSLVRELQLDDHAVPPSGDSFADAARVEQAVATAGLAYQALIEAATGVKNNARRQGFDEPIAQQMGQMAFVKLLGFGG